MEDMALKYLQKNELLNIGMIFPIKRKTAKILYAKENGVLLKELKSEAYMLCVDNFNLGKDLTDLIDDGKLFNIYQEFMVDYILNKFNLSSILDCHQIAYLSKNPIVVSAELTVKKLTFEYLDIIFNHYNSYVDLDYLKRRILDGEIYGGFLKDDLCGFVGTHEEGSLGILEIFPEYRNKGYGTLLEGFMINLYLKKGFIPFGQVKIDNYKSLNLQKKMGMEISEEKIYWIF